MPLTQQPLPAEDGWKEQAAPELIKWEKPGETAVGVLTGISHVVLDGKKVRQYIVTLGEKVYKFLGTYDLTQKITGRHLGCQLRVKYLGTDDNIKGGPSNQPMKVFSVQYKGTASAAEPVNVHGVAVTDDDIPF